MQGGIYDVFLKNLTEKKVDFQRDAIRVALMTEDHVHVNDDRAWGQICHNEIGGYGYKRGGKQLSNVKIKERYDTIVLVGDDIIWRNATFTMRKMVMYFAESKILIATWGAARFGEGRDYIVICGNLTIQWHRRGIIVEYFPDEPPEYLKYYLEKERS